MKKRGTRLNFAVYRKEEIIFLRFFFFSFLPFARTFQKSLCTRIFNYLSYTASLAEQVCGELTMYAYADSESF